MYTSYTMHLIRTIAVSGLYRAHAPFEMTDSDDQKNEMLVLASIYTESTFTLQTDGSEHVGTVPVSVDCTRLQALHLRLKSLGTYIIILQDLF